MNRNKWILFAAALVALVAVLMVSCGSSVTPEKPGNTAFGNDSQQTGSETGDTTAADTGGETVASVPDITVSFGVTEKDEDWGEPDVPTTQQPTQQQTSPSTQATQPEQTQPQDTTAGTEPVEEMTYEKYISLLENEQLAFVESFPSQKDFIRWFNAAREAYEATQNDYTLDPDDPNVDFGDLVGNQP